MNAQALRLTIALALAALIGVPVMKAAEEEMITILHTNDIHGHIDAWQGWEGELTGKTIGGMDRLATAIKQVRSEEDANVLLLDAGDAIGDTMIANETRGEAVLRLMNALGYDAMTIGNHEPDFTSARLRELSAVARFPILAANVRHQKSGELFTKPYLIREIGGVKVGVIGLAYPNTSLTTAEKNVAELEFRDIPAVAREFVPQMRKEGAEIVIALTHYGLGADLKLAQSVPGIDVIVGGHSHNRVEPAIKEGETLIVQAGAHGSDLGRLDLKIAHGKIVSSESNLILLDHAKIPSDPEMAKLSRGHHRSLQGKARRATWRSIGADRSRADHGRCETAQARSAIASRLSVRRYRASKYQSRHRLPARGRLRRGHSGRSDHRGRSAQPGSARIKNRDDEPHRSAGARSPRAGG